MKSIRSFLLTRLLGGAAFVLTGAGFAVYVVVTRSLEAQFDMNLSDRVKGLASLLFQVEDDVEFEFSGELMPEYEEKENPAFFELWFEDGTLLEKSESLRGEDLIIAGTPKRQPMHWAAVLPDGRQGRFVAQQIEVHHVYPEEGPDRPTAAILRVVVAQGLEQLVAAENMVLIGCVAGSLVLMVLIALLSFISVNRGLAPAHRLATTLDAIEVDQLPESIDVGALPRELAPVADKTDALIRRVDTALKRERRTTADIAHELRTPISELLTVAEVALRNGSDPQETRKALETARDVASRMGRSVSTLLKLARLEMGAERFDRETVDLGAIVGELMHSLSAVERERGLRVNNLVEEGDTVEGDREVLRIVVSNLLANAVYYSPQSGVVDCRLDRSKNRWSLLVQNDAGDLQAQDLPTLIEPFWRKDRARADRDRSGLGLALSHALAEKAGMELSFELEGRTFRAILADKK